MDWDKAREALEQALRAYANHVMWMKPTREGGLTAPYHDIWCANEDGWVLAEEALKA